MSVNVDISIYMQVSTYSGYLCMFISTICVHMQVFAVCIYLYLCSMCVCVRSCVCACVHACPYIFMSGRVHMCLCQLDVCVHKYYVSTTIGVYVYACVCVATYVCMFLT